MQRFTEDRETFLLHLEFMIHAARNPKLSKQLGQRMAALRLEIERRLAAREEEANTELPLPPADLALIWRALGIGLAVEALNQPGEINTHLYGDFVSDMAGVTAAAMPVPVAARWWAEPDCSFDSCRQSRSRRSKSGRQPHPIRPCWRSFAGGCERSAAPTS